MLHEEGSVGALHARVHAPAEPRPRHALGRWTAQVAAQMDRGVASEQASGVWGEEGLGQARSRQARLPTCRQPPRWSRAEQVAMPWGHAGHPRPSAWPGPQGVTLPETAVPRDTLQSRDVLCQQALRASAVPHLGCPGSRGLGGGVRQGRAASPGVSLLILGFLQSFTSAPRVDGDPGSAGVGQMGVDGVTPELGLPGTGQHVRKVNQESTGLKFRINNKQFFSAQMLARPYLH